MKNCIYCGKLLEENESVCPACGKEIREYHSLEEYSYHAIPSDTAEILAKQKMGLLSKGDLKKLVESTKNGQAQMAQIVVDKVWKEQEHTVDDMEEEYLYVNIADQKGYPAPQAIQIIGEIPEAGDTAVLFRYMKKKTWSYAFFTQKEYEKLTDNLKNVLDVQNNGTIEREMPTMEGSIADKVGGLLGGLFSRKKK